MKRMIVAMMMAVTFLVAAPFSMAGAVTDHGTGVGAEPKTSSQSYGDDDKKGDDGEKDGEDDKGDDEEGDSW